MMKQVVLSSARRRSGRFAVRPRCGGHWTRAVKDSLRTKVSNDALPALRAVRHSRRVRLLDHGCVRAREQVDVVIIDRATRKHHAMRVKGSGRDGRIAALLVQVVAVRLEAAQESAVHVVYLDAVPFGATARDLRQRIAS